MRKRAETHLDIVILHCGIFIMNIFIIIIIISLQLLRFRVSWARWEEWGNNEKNYYASKKFPSLLIFSNIFFLFKKHLHFEKKSHAHFSNVNKEIRHNDAQRHSLILILNSPAATWMCQLSKQHDFPVLSYLCYSLPRIKLLLKHHASYNIVAINFFARTRFKLLYFHSLSLARLSCVMDVALKNMRPSQAESNNVSLWNLCQHHCV